jgi:hypothetical protein
MASSQLVFDLEFVQMLTNPAYLSFLAQSGCFQDETFLAYLDYLHWLFVDHEQSARYAILLSYPNALVLLRCLRDHAFRRQLQSNQNGGPDAFTNYIHTQQFHQWANNP